MFSRWRYGGKGAEKLLLVPRDLRTSDPSFAAETYHGQFGLAGQVAQTGALSPFKVFPPPSDDWERELHGFGWLRHLRVAGDGIAREQARALVREWIAEHRSITGVAWESEVVARRLISWLSHSVVVLEGADAALYDAFMGAVTRQMRYLSAAWRDAPDGMPRLMTLSALMFGGLCVSDSQQTLDKFEPIFSAEVERQILPDGGHITRRPDALLDVLIELLPLRQCFTARDRVAPAALVSAIDRIMPMLRFFRLGDGSLVRFNGTGATRHDLLGTVLAYDDVLGLPVTFASDAGYCRMERGETLVIAEVGGAPPLSVSTEAHAGALSFEMSSGVCAIVVNCGAPGLTTPDWRFVARATAAHSTLAIADVSSAKFATRRIGELGTALVPMHGPEHVTATLRPSEEGIELRASHDGYDAAYGLTHMRRLTLSPGGERLAGEDTLTTPQGLKRAAQGALSFSIRFHLHPTVAAEATADGAGVVLTLSNGQTWRLSTQNVAVSIEESAFLALNRGPKRTLQIVLSGQLQGASELRVDWLIERVGPVGPAGDDKRTLPAPAKAPEPDGQSALSPPARTPEDQSDPSAPAKVPGNGGALPSPAKTLPPPQKS